MEMLQLDHLGSSLDLKSRKIFDIKRKKLMLLVIDQNGWEVDGHKQTILANV